MKRNQKNNIPKPNYFDTNREIHGVLRDPNGCMIFSEFENGKVVYRLTSIKDLPIKPNNIGRREFRKNWITELSKYVVDTNYIGEIFMYCTHQKTQNLLPINEFTINRGNNQYHRMDKDGYPYQPYCKESKKEYQNGPGNKLRSSQQLFEGSLGSRTRGLTTALYLNDNKPSIDEIFKKFNGKCFATDKVLDINDRSSFEIDHFMPASGYHPLNSNTAVLLSPEANQRKKDHHPYKFYGPEKFKKLCELLDYDVDNIKDVNYILNDEVLFNFNKNFEKIMGEWYKINRDKISFKKYLIKEKNRIKKLDIYERHSLLLKKIEKYEQSL
jgi:hypothetical protein